jgi:hypothetical protein
MSMTPGEHLTRGAERITLSAPIAAIFADADAQLIEISLVGTRVLHTSAITPGAIVDLELLWRGEPIRLSAKVSRTEVRVVDARQTFTSDLHFCSSIFESPAAIRKIVGLLVAEPIAPERWLRLASRHSSAPYLEYTFHGANWQTQRVWVPQQPREGFTMIAPEHESAAEPFCRRYEAATPDERRLIRASAELSIVLGALEKRPERRPL